MGTSVDDSFTYSVASGFSNMYVFGDSLSDMGRLFAATGGMIPPAPIYANGRLSNGPVWAEYVADDLNLDLNLGNNFAIGGRFDWHVALLALACVAALLIPLSSALAGRPPADTKAPQSIGEALREAMREKGFHLLFWGYFVCGFHIAMLTVHLPSFVTDAGLKPEHGMTALALIGLFNIVGTLGAGWLGGRFSKKYLLSGIYLIRGALISMLVFLPLSTFTLYAFACGIGLLWLGTVPLTNGLVGQIFGMRYAAMLASIVFFGHQIGSFVGVWLAGYMYDTTGSYSVAFMASIGLSLFAAAVNLPVNETPLAQRRAVPAAA